MHKAAQQKDYSLLCAAAAVVAAAAAAAGSRLEGGGNYTPDTNFIFEDSLFAAKGTNKGNSS